MLEVKMTEKKMDAINALIRKEIESKKAERSLHILKLSEDMPREEKLHHSSRKTTLEIEISILNKLLL